MDQDSVDAAIAAVGHKATYAGAGASAFGWLASVDMVSIAGLMVAMLGVAVNIVFKIRDDRRKQQLLEAQLRQIGKAG